MKKIVFETIILLVAAVSFVFAVHLYVWISESNDIRGDIIRLAIGDRPVIANVTIQGGNLNYGLSVHDAGNVMAYNFNSVGKVEITGNDYAERNNSSVMMSVGRFWDGKGAEVTNYKLLCPNKSSQEQKNCRDNFFNVKKVLSEPMPLPE